MRRKRTDCFVRCAALVLSLSILLPVCARAETIDEVQARQEELHKENEALELKLQELKDDEDELLNYQAALEEKIDLTEKKIDAAREAVQTLDREIQTLEKKLELSRKEHQDTITLFSERIKTLYKMGSVGTLEILLSSNSFSDFTTRTTLLSSVAKHDQALLEKIEEYLKETQDDREAAKKLREQEAQIKKELEADQTSLQALYAENDALIAELEEKKLITQETITSNNEEDAALEAKLQDLIRQKNEEEERRRQEQEQQQQQGGGAVSPSAPGIDGFSPCWPLPGYGIGNITGHFGDMYDNGPHNGMDIGVPYGTPIVAAESGQVLSAEYHWSWGNNVLIWHNGSFSTRYAHMSSMAVSPGEYVEKEQVIGYVGSTGYSFGNHLHFEVYADAVRVAPEPYLGLW